MDPTIAFVTKSLTNLSYIGYLKSLNDLAKTAKADYILHTGDFGFYDNTSLERIAEKYAIMTPPGADLHLTHHVGH